MIEAAVLATKFGINKYQSLSALNYFKLNKNIIKPSAPDKLIQNI